MENNEVYNEHLNIFNYYNRGKTCEDNLSRILARILLEDRYKQFQIELFSNEGLLSKLNLDDNIEYVFSHVNTNTIKNYIINNNIEVEECIPVTLTDNEKSIDNQSEQAKSPVPDIVILINKKLIFIEVKLGTEIPKKQVLNQIKTYMNNKNYEHEVIQIYWKDIIKALSKLYADDFFIKDYLQLIDSDYSNWFDFNFREIIEKMEKDGIVYKETRDLYDKNNLINVRIYKLLDNYCKKNKIPKHPDFEKRRAFPLNNSFASEMQFRFNPKNKSLESHIWTGELIDYTKEFYNYYEFNKDKVNLFTNDKSNPYKADYYVVPYILFRDHFRYLKDFNIYQMKNKFLPKDICESLSHRKKYSEFKNIINNQYDYIKKYIPDIKEYYEYVIDEYYKETNRTNMTISIGYDIVISYPSESYMKLDDQGRLEELVEDSLKVFEKYFETEVTKN